MAPLSRNRRLPILPEVGKHLFRLIYKFYRPALELALPATTDMLYHSKNFLMGTIVDEQANVQRSIVAGVLHANTQRAAYA